MSFTEQVNAFICLYVYIAVY